MPNPIMLTEAAFFYESACALPRARRRIHNEFEAFAEMRGVDVGRLDAAVLHAAKNRCGRCACRAACRRWLRTGAFDYSGDPRCPNATLLSN